jgi:hypothetical protein
MKTYLAEIQCLTSISACLLSDLECTNVQLITVFISGTRIYMLEDEDEKKKQNILVSSLICCIFYYSGNHFSIRIYSVFMKRLAERV